MDGNWIPIHKNFSQFLPHTRPYTELEAVFSIQYDYDKSNPVTVIGYAQLWQWSRKKVMIFLERIGVQIVYPEDTAKRQNQKGQIRVQIRDRSGTDQGQINFIDNKVLHNEKNRSGTDQGQIRDRSGDTTIKNIRTENNNKKKDIVLRVISHLNEKTGKSFRPDTKETERLIEARLNASFTESDLIKVIDGRCSKWLADPKMIEYLRPSTLFGTKFESYLNDFSSPQQAQVFIKPVDEEALYSND